MRSRSRPERKLQSYLSQTVIPFSEHYRKLFKRERIDPRSIRTLDDLRRIPFTTKDDLIAAESPKEFVLVPDRKVLSRRPTTILSALTRGKAAVARDFEREFRPLLLTSTTGRSSVRVPFIYSAHDVANLRTSGARVMRACGAEREMRMMNMFPFAPHLAFWLAHYAGMEFGVFMLSTGGGKTMGTEGNLALIKKIQPDVLIAMPTFLYHVLREALDSGLKCPNLKKLVLGGEKAPEGIRRKLRELAAQLGSPRVDVLATYGFTESKMAYSECPPPEGAEPSGYHLYPDLGIVEVIDPDSGDPVAEGEPGEIVFTPLDARGTVVLRYRTGDIIEGGLDSSPCPHCGRAVPRLVGRISRRSEFREVRLDKLKGTIIDFNGLEHILDNAPHIGSWQIELRKANDDPHDIDEVILHVEALGGVEENELQDIIRERFRAGAEFRPNRIEFHDNGEMRRLQGVGSELKEQRLIDHRPKAGEVPV